MMKNVLLMLASVLSLGACNKPSSSDNTTATPSTPQPQSIAEVSAAPRTPWDGNALIKAIFPDANAVKSIPLDYESFAFIDNGGMAAVPLPPFLGQATVIHVMPNAAGYHAVAGSEQCGDKIILKAGEVTLAELDPKDPSSSYELMVDGQANPQGQDIGIWLAPGAKVNYNCVIKLTPST